MVIFDSARLYSLAPAAGLQQGGVGLVGAVDERGQPGLLVALQHAEVDHPDGQDDRDQRQSRQVPARRPADQQHGHQHRGQHQRRSQIGLLVDQGERDGGQDQHHDQAAGP